MTRYSSQNTLDFNDYFYNDYLVHHGILGMKWGIRRYQNEDGSLTPKGKKKIIKIQKYSDKNKIKISKLERKAANYKLKASKAQYRGQAKKFGKFQVKSDKLHFKASKIEGKLSKNEAFVRQLNTSMKSLSSKKVENGKSLVEQYLSTSGLRG